MQDESDAQLLRQYVTQKSESAFAALVQRHAGLVYSAALRQVPSADWAEEIGQRVFIDLAHKAHSLAGQVKENGSLAGWLYQATRYAALNLLREERRRQSRETQLMQDFQSTSESVADWTAVAPLLDEALSALSEQEREALLLRFFKNQDFRTVGATLGVSDDTAQKRVARSLEKLRAALAQRGVTTTSAGLAAVMVTNSVQSVPVGLAIAWTGASLASVSAGTGATLTFLKVMTMTKMQVGLGLVIIGGLAVTATLEHRSGRRAQEENEALRQQLASLAADHSAQTKQPAPIPSAPTFTDEQMRELLRLRGEVASLREEAKAAAKLREQNQALEARARGLEEMFRFEASEGRIGNAGKQIAMAFYSWARTNPNVAPGNFAFVSADFSKKLTAPLDTFEMVDADRPGFKARKALLAQERTPRRIPAVVPIEGLPAPEAEDRGERGWERTYIFRDGSVQHAQSKDGNFADWERENTAPILEAGQ